MTLPKKTEKGLDGELVEPKPIGIRPFYIAMAVPILCGVCAWIWNSAWFIRFGAILFGVLFELDWQLQRRQGNLVPGEVIGHEYHSGTEGSSHWRPVVSYVDGKRTGTFESQMAGASPFRFLMPRVGKRVDVLIVRGEPSLRWTLKFRAPVIAVCAIFAVIPFSEVQPTIRSAQASQVTLIQKKEWNAEDLPALAKASEGNPADTEAAMSLAALQLWFGQEDAYTNTRRRMLEWSEGSLDFQVAERVAKLASLYPNSDAMLLDATLTMAQTAEIRAPRPYSFVQMANGMAYYRAGNYQAADQSMKALVPGPASTGSVGSLIGGTCGFYQAMSLFQQGRHDEAKQLYNATLATMKPFPSDERNPLADGATHDDLILWLASREAKALLNK